MRRRRRRTYPPRGTFAVVVDGDEDVVRLDVPQHDAARCHVVEPAQQLNNHRARLGGMRLKKARFDKVAEVHANARGHGDARENEPERAVGVLGVVDHRHAMRRARQSGCNASFILGRFSLVAAACASALGPLARRRVLCAPA